MNQETNQEKAKMIRIPTPHDQEFYFGVRNHKAVSDTILLHQRLGMKKALSSGIPQCDLLLERGNGKPIGIIPRIALAAVWDKAEIYTKQNTAAKLGISEGEWQDCLAKITQFLKNDQKIAEDRPLLIQDLLDLSELTFECLFLHKADKVIALIDAAIKGDIQETAKLKKRWKRIKKYLHKVPVEAEKGGIFSEEDTAILHRNGIHFLNQFRKQDIYALKNMLLSHPMTHLVEEINEAFKEDLARRRDFRYKFYPILCGCLALLGVTVVGYEHKYTLIKNLNMTLVMIALTVAFLIDCAAIVYGTFRAIRRRRKRPEYRYFSKPVRKAFGCLMAFAIFSLGSATVFYERYDGYDDILYYRDLEDGTIAVAGLRDEEVDTLTIPAAIDGKAVSEIDIACFRNDGISNVRIIPEQIKIDRYAFVGCSSLAGVDLTHATAIGAHAFEDCTGMTSVVLPDASVYTEVQKATFKNCHALLNISDLSAITTFGDEAFYDCFNLLGFAFNEQLSAIGKESFFNCSRFEVVEIPGAIQTLGEEAFVGCNQITSITLPFIATERGKEEKYSLSDFFTCDHYEFSLKLTEATGVYTKSLDDCTALRSLSLPDGLTVIEAGAFDGLTSLTTMNIPDGVTVIEESCFEDCSTLVEVVGCEGITTVGKSAFKNCALLTYISLPSAVEIQDEAFEGCSSLVWVEFSPNLTTIGEGAFRKCSALEVLTVPNSVATIGKNAFAECFALRDVSIPFVGESRELIKNGFEHVFGSNKNFSTLTVTSMHTVAPTTFDGAEHLSELYLNEGITKIEKESFENFYNIKSFVLPTTLTSIGDNAFANCTALEVINLDQSAITEIGEGVFKNCRLLEWATLPVDCAVIPDSFFENCSKLDSIVLPTGIVKIGANAFSGSGLQVMTLHEGITEIGEKAFYNCDGLLEIDVPDSVSAIGKHAFAECSSLAVAEVPFLGKDINNSKKGYRHLFENDYALTSLAVTAMTVIGKNTFTGSENLSVLALNEGVTTIEKNAFKNLSLSSISLPSTLTTIGKSAFYGCHRLTAIDLSATAVTALEKSSFESCTALTTLILPDVLSVIPKGLAKNCTALTEITLPSALRTIEDEAFYGTRLIAVNFPQTLEHIGKSAFQHTSLTDLMIPDSVVTMGKNAFANCYELENIVSPFVGESRDKLKKGYQHLFAGDYATMIALTSMTSIGPKTFQGGGSLVEIYLNEGLTTVEKAAFKDCYSLEIVTFPSTLTTIEANAFENCVALTMMDLAASSVTAVGDYAFKNCSSLTYLTLPNTLSAIPKGFAMGCSELTDIQLSSELREIGDQAFSGSGLEYVVFPETVERIGKEAFLNCQGIVDLIVPDSVTEMGKNAFGNCYSLTTVQVPFLGKSRENVKNGYKHLFGSTASSISQITTTALTVVESNTFAGAEQVSVLQLNEGVTEIKAKAFDNFSQLTSFAFPTTLTSIGKKAFYNCNALLSVNLYNTAVGSIGKQAFGDCTDLYQMYLPSALTEIPDSMASDCFNLEVVILPAGLTSIGKKAFLNCTDLAAMVVLDVSESLVPGFTVRIPDAVSEIGSRAFENCSSIKEISFGVGLKEIKSKAFFGCNSIVSVKLADGLTEVGQRAFADCYELTSISIPSSVTKMGSDICEGCSVLYEITVPFLGKNAKSARRMEYFTDSLYVSTVTITAAKKIANRAFAACPNLATLTLNDGIEKFGKEIVSGCTKLTFVFLPVSLSEHEGLFPEHTVYYIS